MNPQQIDLVLSSYTSVKDDPAVTKRFYELLFEAEPSARALFRHLPETESKFAEELGVLAACLNDLDRFEARALALGARHRGYGVSTRHYAAASDALVQALNERLGESFTDEVAAAWRAAFDLVAETMMAGAAAPEPSNRGSDSTS